MRIGVVWVAACIVCASSVGRSAQTATLASAGSLPGPIEMIRVQGQRAYVTNRGALTALDITMPTAPKTLGTYTFPEPIWGFRVVGSTVYVTADRFGLGIIEAAPNGTLTLRGSLKTPGQAKNVAVSGSTALVTDFVSGLDFVDIMNPARPVLSGSAFLDGFATDVVSAGSHAYVADRPTGFYVFDLSTHGSFEPVASLQSAVPSNTQRAQLEVLETSAKKRIVILVAGGLLQPFDVTTPTAPAKLPPFKTPGGAVRMALKGSLAYIADGPEGLQVVDLADPAAPTIVAAFKTSAPARDVAVADAFVYVGLVTGEVVILRH